MPPTDLPSPEVVPPIEARKVRTGLLLGYCFAALGSLLFASKGVLIKLMYADGADTETVLALRMAFALPVYLIIAYWAVRRRRREGRALPARAPLIRAAAIGLLGYYLASYLDFLGLVFITAQFERLILFTYPMFVMILGALFFGGRITGWGVSALAVSYAGLALIFVTGLTAFGQDVVTGSLLVLAASLAFALYQLLAKQIITATGSAIFTCAAMVSASLAALLHYALVNGFNMGSLSGQVIALGATIAMVATVLPSFLLNAALDKVGPQATAAFGTLSPLGTIALAVIVLGEAFTVIDGIGTALVVAGVGFYTLMDQRAKR